MKNLCDPVAVTKESALNYVTDLRVGKAKAGVDIEAGILASDTLYYATRNWRYFIYRYIIFFVYLPVNISGSVYLCSILRNLHEYDIY